MDQARRPVVALSLQHWFTNHQLTALRATHFHLPGAIDIDVTLALDTVGATQATALVIKALGLLLEGRPEMNRLFVRTFWGDRLVRPDYIAVNVPIRLEVDGKPVLAAAFVQEPQRKSITEIACELKASRARGLADKPVAAFLHRRRNHWYNRLLLRIFHGLLYRSPRFYLRRRGGGVSLSSLLAQGKQATPMTTVSFGPTMFTVALTSQWRDGGRHWIRLGVAFDHFAGEGTLAVNFARYLSDILSGRDARNFSRLVGEVAVPASREMAFS